MSVGKHDALNHAEGFQIEVKVGKIDVALRRGCVSHGAAG